MVRFFDNTCAAPLLLRPAFTGPTIYRRDNSVTSDPTLMIGQVDDIMASAAHETDRNAILEGITNRMTFEISPHRTTLFYATDIDQTALYIKVHARFISPPASPSSDGPHLLRIPVSWFLCRLQRSKTWPSLQDPSTPRHCRLL
jgi:hypothetical protein